ncbi:Uma2 family endonuclease [Scytonema sp. NUACC21]
MIAQPQHQLMTPQEYLGWEEQQPIKYEYINGDVFAMTGGTLPHNSIAINLTSALKNYLRGKGCKVFMADAKVGVSLQGPFHYPDVMVSCDPRDQRARQVIYHPCLLVEVLSPGTEAYDRGKKFRHYRRIDTLKEYVLIDADKMNVECYRLNEKGKWELTFYSPEETTANGTELEVHLTSVDFRCPISLLYEDVVFPENEPEETSEK